ncbi:hypothetical protein [Actinomadura sp. HBU206391]|uniref:hypothetical protein n=1 Tax=Actinomadura sp. HBU206391 TaxID=2731692 RepID=UPI001C9CE04D|nr:hypothetical protein [Actinomadura sp. HBU206391]
MHRQIAGKLTGRISKWIVLVASILVLGVMMPLNAKLVDVQNNEAASWLPGSAESTKVVEELTGTVNPNDIPTLVVYHRDSGLTPEDFAAMDEHAEEIAQIDGVVADKASSRPTPLPCANKGSPSPSWCPRTARSPISLSRSTSARTAGSTSPMPPTRSATSPR